MLSEMQTKAHKLTEKWKLFTRTQRSGKQGVYVTETEKGRERSMLNKKTKKTPRTKERYHKRSQSKISKKKSALYITIFFVTVVIVDITICKYNL